MLRSRRSREPCLLSCRGHKLLLKINYNHRARVAQTTCPVQSEFTSEPGGRATYTQLLLQKEQPKVMTPSWNQEDNTPGKNHHVPGDLGRQE